ncbi:MULTISPECIES: ATP-binding protein [unclassified Nostoc]|uniref:ATP-binding protein n=1 Tax=unclassified Nostoc TaxID=2593658 RepID=UPI0030068F0E
MGWGLGLYWTQPRSAIFYITKPVGSGTGLGMSISYQIINKHDGQLKCISAPLQGTKFIIQIPIRIKSV